MQQRQKQQIEAARRQRSTRARRGLVAGYIHTLSARHAQERPQRAATSPARSA